MGTTPTGRQDSPSSPADSPPLSRRLLYFSVFGLAMAAIVGITVFLIYNDTMSRLNPETRHEGKAVTAGVKVSPFVSFAQERAFPMGIVTAPDNSFYVSLMGTGAIQKVSSDGQVSNWKQVTAGGAMAVGPDNTLYIIDYSTASALAFGRLKQITPDGKIGTVGDDALKLPLMAQLATDKAGNVYISQPQAAEIWRMTPGGAAAVWWTVPSVGQIKAQPVGLNYDPSGNILLVADAGTGTIYRIDVNAAVPNGVSVFRQAGIDLRAVTLDKEGRILVAIWTKETGQLARLEKDGKWTILAEGFRAPKAILYRDNKVYVVNSDALGLIGQIKTEPPYTVDIVDLSGN